MTRADSVEASIGVMVVLLLQSFDVSICILDNLEFLIAVLSHLEILFFLARWSYCLAWGLPFWLAG